MKTDLIEKTETGDDNKNSSNPFEDSDNDDEDTVLDHINLSRESETGDSKNGEEKDERESVKEDFPQDESSEDISVDGEQTEANYTGESRSRNESDERKDGEGGRCDDNILKDTKDILEEEETEDCKNTCKDGSDPILQTGTPDEEESKQPDTSEEVNISIRCEVGDILSNTNVSSSESVTVKESDEPKEAANDGQTEDSGTYDFFQLNHTLLNQKEVRRNSVFCVGAFVTTNSSQFTFSIPLFSSGPRLIKRTGGVELFNRKHQLLARLLLSHKFKTKV